MKRIVLFYIWSFFVLIILLSTAAPFNYPNSALPAIFIAGPTVVLLSVISGFAHNGSFNLKISNSSYRRVVRFLGAMFFIFVVLAYLEFFLISGRSVSNIFADREVANISGRSSSVLGGVISLLSASPIVLVAVRYVYSNANGLKKNNAVDLMILALSLPPLLFSGGRSPIVIAGFYLLVIIMICSSRNGILMSQVLQGKLIRLFIISLTGAAILSYVIYVSIVRREIQGTIDRYHLVLRSYSLELTSVYDMLENFSPVMALALTNLYYYLTHAIYRLADMPSYSWAETGGFASFPLYVAILNFIFESDFLSVFEGRLLFPGSYTTLWGAWFQDGHIYGLLLGNLILTYFLFYLLIRSVYRIFEFIILAYLLLTVWLAPIYSVTSTGFGGSLLFVLILVGIVERVRFGSRRVW